MAADASLKNCLDEPDAKGLERLRPWLVDRIKRRALHHLHCSRRGEVLMLRMYLIGEQATEATLQQQLIPSPPEWLEKQMAWHLSEEQDHVRMFADEIARRGAIPDHDAPPDWVSRRKIRQWKNIAERYASRFEQGILVPAYAIGLCAEQMAKRVLTRHSNAVAADHPFQPVLGKVLHDEEKHIRLCRQTLERIVSPTEQADLAALLREVRAVERAWGIRSSAVLYLAGVVFRAATWIGERPRQAQT